MSVLIRFPALRRLSAASLSLPALLCVASAPVWAQVAAPRPVNIVNDKFATVTNGSQTALHVAVSADASDAATRDAVVKRLKANWQAQAVGLSRSVQTLEKAGLLKSGHAAIPISTLIQVEKNGVPVTRAWRGRAVGNGTLTFRYTGWSEQDQILIQGLIDRFTPRIEAIYGKPAVSGEVEIVNVGTLDSSKIPQIQRLFAFGGYNVSTNQIMLPVFDSNETFAQALLLNLIHAYHGPAVFQYDAWEQGFARAAASVVARTPDYGFADGSANNLFSLLNWYDMLNQPGLGNPTFFPPSQANTNLETTAGGFTLGKMTFPRVGMSGAAWLKVYIENPDFFRQFNEAYYAQYDPATTPSLAGNVPALKGIASSLLTGGVEGLPFEQWYRQQYILDTSVSLGRKLYAFVLPGVFSTTDGQSHLIQLSYYNTKANGDEDLLTGRAYATYHDSSGATVNLGVASEQVDIVDGDGSITTQSFESQEGRLTMDFSVGAESARAYVPSGFTGDLQGIILGTTGSGRDITVTQSASAISRSQTTQSTNAAFGVTMGTGVNDLVKTVVSYTDATGAVKTYRRNTGDGQAYLVLTPDQDSGAVQTVTRTFASDAIPYFVSFPVKPQLPSVPDSLGLGANDFLLSYWDPVATGYISATGDANTSTLGAISPGRGYWFKVQPENRLTGNALVSMTGVAPVTDVDFSVPARYGWNMIGSPFTGTTTAVGDILVQYLQNAPLTWDVAVTQNIVAAKPYRFDRTSGTFAEADTINAPDWEALYFRVLVPGNVTLILPAPDASTRSVVLNKGRSVNTAKPVKPDWTVTLRASQDPDSQTGYFGRLATATLGTAKGATDGYDNQFDREQPPSIVSGVGIGFDAPGSTTKTAGGRYVADFRDATKRKSEWSFTSYAVASGAVRLEWNNVGTVPRSTTLTLTDTETGEKVALRSRSTYVWQATDAKRSRHFTITADAARTTPLALTNLVVTRSVGGTRAQGGGRSYGISYNVTADARVTMELVAMSGKVVKQLNNGGRSVSSGRQSIIWDGRAENGSSLPAGGYTLRVTATPQDGSGSSVTVLRPVVVLN